MTVESPTEKAIRPSVGLLGWYSVCASKLLKENELLNLKPDNFMVVDYFHGEVELPKPALIQRLAAIKKN